MQDPPAKISVMVSLAIRVPSDQQTIQAAINVANNGNTVLVAPGTYVENINFGGKAITVTSESGPDVTKIDGGGADSVVIFTSREGRDSVINGFTLQNGNPGFGGGGVRIASASPTVTNNVITNNRGCAGVGIYVISGSPLIQLNTITGNDGVRCGAGGGGILVYGIAVNGPSSPEILDNVISNNHSLVDGGGIFLNGAGTPTIKRNIIKGNTAQGGHGGGIYMVNQSDALIVQNLITNNQASVGGGLYWYVPSDASGPILVNNTIVDNDAASGGSGIYAEGFDAQTELTNNIIVAKPGQAGLYCGDLTSQSQPIIRFNNIFGATGGMAYGGKCSNMTGMNGNISADPLFANQTQGDYHLQRGSPSIDSGDNQASNLPDKDLDGDLRILDGDGDGTPIVDMGVDEFTGQDRSLPTSTITAPTEGATVLTGTTVNITGIASAAMGRTVVMVEVSVDGGSTWNVATGTTAWSYNWTPALAGPTTIKSRAIDNGRNLQDPPAQVTVTVQDVTPPTSTITSPTAGATVLTGTTVNITGTASDTGGGIVTKVEVSVDGGITYAQATGTISWSFSWTPSMVGPATVRSRAIDSGGNVQTFPTTVAVTVVAPDTEPPTVAAFSPLPGAQGVSVDTNVTVTFSEAMDATTVNFNTVQLLAPSTIAVSANVTYDAATFTATLDPASPLSKGVTYTVLVKGGNSGVRVKDVAGNALAANASSTFTTAVPPPQVVSTMPANGESGVPANIAPAAKFANPLNPNTVNTDTVLLSNTTDALNPVPVAVTVSYEPNTFTVALVPTAPLQPAQIYTATLKGGSTGPRITDTVGQTLAADFTFGFATAPAGPGLTTFTVFTDQTPTQTFDESNPVELGMKFRANEDGVVTGARFYKGDALNGGTHIGHLWDTAGNKLGEVTFAGESENGWQQANFSVPIAITAGTIYVVSYLNPLAHYSATQFFFDNPDGVDNGPLHALSNGDTDSPGNGVLAAGGVFPNQSSNASNYFVDVVFAPASQAPQVLSVNPAPGAAGVLVNVRPAAVFSEALDPTTVTPSTVLLLDGGNNPVRLAVVGYDVTTFTISLLPADPLQPNQAYTVILKGGPSGITDSTGGLLAADYIWSFTTAQGTP
jgi:parallel beta-helix repeat protein